MPNSTNNAYLEYTELPVSHSIGGSSVDHPFMFKVEPGKEMESLTNIVSGVITIGPMAQSLCDLTPQVDAGKEIEILPTFPLMTSTMGYAARPHHRKLSCGLSSTDAGRHASRKYSELFSFPQIDVIRELRMLSSEEKDDPESRLSPYSMRFVYSTIVKARELLSIFNEPRPTYASDGQGGIRVEWKVGRREVRLVVPTNEKGRAYIYSRNELISHMDFSTSPSLLAQTLRTIFAEHRSTG